MGESTPDGSTPLNLTNSPGATETGPQWSPDGNKLLFIRGTNFDDRDVWVMNGDGSGQTNLTNGAFISVSGCRLVTGSDEDRVRRAGQ